MRPATAIPLLALIAALTGCSTSMPRDRVGALPFPGPFTLYAPVDPAHLGTHHYGPWARPLADDEQGHGILYTTRAGFLDLAHLRIAVDWGRHCTLMAHDALAAGQTSLVIPGPDHADIHVALEYPPGWADLPDPDRAKMVDATARQLGPRVAYLILTWHEIATWFGYRSFLFDESRSAFTYDDTIATLIGLQIADRAMNDPAPAATTTPTMTPAQATRAFDLAVTAALDAELHRLGACTPDQTDQAARAVEGLWWAGKRPLKRQTRVCAFETDAVQPWLAPNLPFAQDGDPAEIFPLPRDRAIPGHDITARLEVDPRIRQAQAMRALLPDHPQHFDETRDLPHLITTMRAQMQSQFGPDYDHPDPTPSASLAAHSPR